MAPDILIPSCAVESGDLGTHQPNINQSTLKRVDNGLCSVLLVIKARLHSLHKNKEGHWSHPYTMCFCLIVKLNV